jgi:predicted RND superfamily exporter protein
VPALTGAIMTMGVATANSILMVSFARERLLDGAAPLSAALEAGTTRLRPVLMTALAMIIGMLPMAVGLGEGGEQNAPLGRATIGGLLFATVSTLFFVPVVFAAVHRALERRAARRPQAPDPPPKEMPDMSHAQRHSSLGIHGLHQHEGAHNIQRIKLLRRARWTALALVLALAGGGALVMAQRAAQARALAATGERQGPRPPCRPSPAAASRPCSCPAPCRASSRPRSTRAAAA